jgi:hypothetical protein
MAKIQQGQGVASSTDFTKSMIWYPLWRFVASGPVSADTLHRPAAPRYNPAMDTKLVGPVALSDVAVALLKGYRGHGAVNDSNRAACHELAAVGFLVVGHDFTRGREAFYRMTELGVKLLGVLGRMR